MKLAEAYVDITAKMGGLKTSFKRAQRQTDTFVSKMRAKLKKVDFKQMGRRAMMAGAAISGAFALMGKKALSFNDQLIRIQVQSGATNEQLNAIRDSALSSYFINLGKSASDVATMYVRLASEGYNVAEMQKMLIPITNTSIALKTDENLTTKLMLNLMQQFNMEASDMTKISDTLVGAFSDTSFQGQELADTLKYAGVAAQAVGWSLEETIAVTDRIIKVTGKATMAGTYFRQMLAKMRAPTDEMVKEFKKYDISMDRVADSVKDPIKLIQLLNEAHKKGANFAKMFGARSSTAAEVLATESTVEIKKLTDNLYKEGRAQKAVNKIVKDGKPTLKSIGAVIKNLSIRIGNDLLPAFKKASSRFIEIYDKISEWIKANPKLTAGIIKITAGIGALLLVLGPLLMMMPGIIAIFGAVSFPIVGAIAGITAVVYKLHKALKKPALKDYERTLLNVKKGVKKNKIEFNSLTNRLLILTKKEKLSNEELKIKKDLIKTLNTKYGDYFTNLSDEAKNYDTLKTSISNARIELGKYSEGIIRKAVIKKNADELADLYITLNKLEGKSKDLKETVSATAESILEDLTPDFSSLESVMKSIAKFIGMPIKMAMNALSVKKLAENLIKIQEIKENIKEANKEKERLLDMDFGDLGFDDEDPTDKIRNLSEAWKTFDNSITNLDIYDPLEKYKSTEEYKPKLNFIERILGLESGWKEKLKNDLTTIEEQIRNTSLNLEDIFFRMQYGLTSSFEAVFHSIGEGTKNLGEQLLDIWKSVLIRMISEVLAKQTMLMATKFFKLLLGAAGGGGIPIPHPFSETGYTPDISLGAGNYSKTGGGGMTAQPTYNISINAIDVQSFEQRLQESPDAIVNVVRSNIENRGVLSV